MPSVRVKVCGITNAEDARCAVAAGADALGFIFYPKSPRYVAEKTVREIVKALPPFVTKVGVFVNTPRKAIVETVARCGLNAIQMHGDESPEDCTDYDWAVIRVARVGRDFDASRLASYAGVGVRAFMLDTDKEGLYGGTGETFDWSVAREVKTHGQVILSGGLTPDNVVEGIRTVAPYAVDTGSGVESEPGRKDHEKVRAFVAAAKHVDL